MIDQLKDDEKLIYLCNRVALKRQIKKDLLKKFKLKIPYKTDSSGKKTLYLEELDNIKVINNVTIAAYHAIAEGVKNKKYRASEDDKYSLENYKYIICDECHFMLTDAAFMNKTHLVFEEIVKTYYKNCIVIFISATIDEMMPLIEKAFTNNQNELWATTENSIYKYSTGIDYSYLDIKYFDNNQDIINLIDNDQSDDKWIIFVTKKDDGNTIKQELKDRNIDSVFIVSGTSNDEIKNIIDRSKFDCKVLISTKILDNGVNIQDSQVKNIVVCAHDKTTFIQELGRIRIDIKKPYKIKLYIKSMGKKSFLGKLNFAYKPKLEAIALFEKDIKEFKRLYNLDVDQIYPDIFYLDENNQWKVNTTGHIRLLRDSDFAKRMIDEFEVDDHAYIKQQLNWISRDNEFSESNYINNVVENDDIHQLMIFLDNAYNNNERFTKQYFIKCVMEIIDNSKPLRIKLNKIQDHINRSKGCKTFNKLFELCDLSYIVSSRRYTTNNRKETKWIVTVIDS